MEYLGALAGIRSLRSMSGSHFKVPWAFKCAARRVKAPRARFLAFAARLKAWNERFFSLAAA